jgi:hypothetical protein
MPKHRLKQIQFLLGHDKLDTTARYVNDEQKFGGEAVSKAADINYSNKGEPPEREFDLAREKRIP